MATKRNIPKVKHNCHLLKNKQGMNDICHSLFSSTEIKFYGLKRAYKNNTEIMLSTDVLFSKHIYEQGHAKNYDYAHAITQSNTQNTSKKSHQGFLSTFNPEAYLYSKKYGLAAPFTILEEADDYVDIHIFSSDPGTELLEFYNSHLDLLHQFKFYFYDKAKNMIADAHQTLLSSYPSSITSNDQQKAIETLKSKLTPKRYYFNYIGREVYLTPREMQVLHMLTKHGSYKKIAGTLNISVRTVETHINTMCDRLGLNCSSELKKIYYNFQLGILNSS